MIPKEYSTQVHSTERAERGLIRRAPMANTEHIAALKRASQWNSARGTRFTGLVKADLTRLDLTRADLTRADLGREDLPGAKVFKVFLDDEKTLLSRADLREANLARFDLREIDLAGADLTRADLTEIDLTGARLTGANLRGANLIRAKLTGADLTDADLTDVNLTRADLRAVGLAGASLAGADLTLADLTGADLAGANLSDAELSHARLISTNLQNSTLDRCRVYGLSVWDANTAGGTQSNLIVTPEGQPQITVDNLQVAQFIYLLLTNKNIRDVIDSITSKVVLILGRYTPERKAVLDRIRDALRQRNYLPVLVDFTKPDSRDITETVSTLAHMARFIIADITDAKSIPQELQRVVPDLPSVPVQPLLLSSQREYGMFEHFRRYPWVLETFLYDNQDQLLECLEANVIAPAETKVLEMRCRG
jgi:uncharacterized protein YjbI with pentapeptide repeats